MLLEEEGRFEETQRSSSQEEGQTYKNISKHLQVQVWLWVQDWRYGAAALPQLKESQPSTSLHGWALNQPSVSASPDSCLDTPVWGLCPAD